MPNGILDYERWFKHKSFDRPYNIGINQDDRKGRILHVCHFSLYSRRLDGDRGRLPRLIRDRHDGSRPRPGLAATTSRSRTNDAGANTTKGRRRRFKK